MCQMFSTQGESSNSSTCREAHLQLQDPSGSLNGNRREKGHVIII